MPAGDGSPPFHSLRRTLETHICVACCRKCIEAACCIAFELMSSIDKPDI